MDFEILYYTVSKIDGDYAILSLDGTEETILVARALLPMEIDEGTHLKLDRSVFLYEIVD